MNHAVPSVSFAIVAARPRATGRTLEQIWQEHEEVARLRRMRSLIALFSLYTAVLLVVVMISDGADIGCVLGGIAGHVLYATHRLIVSWRDAAWLEHARVQASRRLRLRRA
jgi:hypothetical protein